MLHLHASARRIEAGDKLRLIIKLKGLWDRLEVRILLPAPFYAGVAELVYAPDSGRVVPNEEADDEAQTLSQTQEEARPRHLSDRYHPAQDPG